MGLPIYSDLSNGSVYVENADVLNQLESSDQIQCTSPFTKRVKYTEYLIQFQLSDLSRSLNWN